MFKLLPLPTCLVTPPTWPKCHETVFVLLGLLVICQFGCKKSETVERTPIQVADFNAESIRPKVVAFCGDCHGMPDPTSFPRRAWYDEVQQGYSFYWDSGRKDLAAPPLGEVVSFFQSQAPEEIARRPTHQEKKKKK